MNLSVIVDIQPFKLSEFLRKVFLLSLMLLSDFLYSLSPHPESLLTLGAAGSFYGFIFLIFNIYLHKIYSYS